MVYLLSSIEPAFWDGNFGIFRNTNLVQSKIRTVPCQEQDRGVRAISPKCGVGDAIYIIPRDEWLAVDAYSGNG